MNNTQMATELLRVAKTITAYSALAELKDHGKFAKGSKLYFHGFPTIDAMIYALDRGSFGRKGMTSIGTPHGYVPYFHRIWFIRPTVSLYPVYYYDKKSPFDPVEMKQMIGAVYGIKWTRAQVSSMSNYGKEEEWYSLDRVSLNKIKITALQYPARSKEDKAAVIREWCERLNVVCFFF